MKTSWTKKKIPKRCIDPLQYCQGCKYGGIIYPEWVETREDAEGCCFDTYCIYHLEKTKPSLWSRLQLRHYFKKIERRRKRDRKKSQQKDNHHISI